jgi:hypothetical protein
VLIVVVVVGSWDVTPSCVWLHANEVLFTGCRGHCVRMMDVFLRLVFVDIFFSGG